MTHHYRRIELLGFFLAVAIVAVFVAIATHEPPEPVRKFGPQAWEADFRPNRG